MYILPLAGLLWIQTFPLNCFPTDSAPCFVVFHNPLLHYNLLCPIWLPRSGAFSSRPGELKSEDPVKITLKVKRAFFAVLALHWIWSLPSSYLCLPSYPQEVLNHVRLTTQKGQKNWPAHASIYIIYSGSSSHLRTMLPESSSRPLPARWPNHATYLTRNPGSATWAHIASS